jgi:hypothetical protein
MSLVNGYNVNNDSAHIFCLKHYVFTLPFLEWFRQHLKECAFGFANNEDNHDEDVKESSSTRTPLLRAVICFTVTNFPKLFHFF